jgi:Uma2 family endonuclease
MNIGFAIGLYLREHPIGAVFSVPVDVILSAHDVVEPDVLFYTHERARTFEASPWIRGVPNLVVEVASPSTRRRDQTTKRALYERFGVDEYWLVDPDERSILVLRLRDGVYEEAARVRGEGDVLRTPLMPAMELEWGVVFGS